MLYRMSSSLGSRRKTMQATVTRATPMATGTILPPLRPAITPPSAPTIMPIMQTMRLPNLFASGTTITEATAMGIAPRMDSRDWEAPHASAEPKKVLSSTHLQK